MKKLAKKPGKQAGDLDGYFKVFLGSTNFHLLMKDLIRQQMTRFDLALVFSRNNTHGDCTALFLDTKLRNSFLKKVALMRHIQQSLHGLLLKHGAAGKPIAVFFPSDEGIVYQFAISYLRRNAREVKLIMYEDGLGSLRDRREFRDRSVWKKIKKRAYRLMLLGNYYNTGGFRSCLADHYVGLSKEAFREECSSYSKPLTVLEMKKMAGLLQKGEMAFLGKRTHIFLSEVLVEDHIISARTWLEYIEASAGAIARVTDELYVKPHPRENGDKFQETVDILKKHVKRVEVMGQRVSIEEFVNGIKDRHNLVLHGCRTGGLYYVKLLYPEIEVVMHHEHLMGKSSELDSNIRFHRKLMESAGCKV